MKNIIMLSISLAIVLLSCKPETDSSENKIAPSAGQDVWADQIEAHSSFVTPEGWAEEDWKAVNKNVDQQKIFTTIMDAVVSGKHEAYDFFTDSLYTLQEAKARLSTIKAEDISSVRTREAWHFDKEKFKLMKHVTRLYLFTKKLDENGEFMGDKALFYVKLND